MDEFLLSPFFAEYLPFSFLISEAIHHIFPSPLSFLLIQEIRPQLRRIACLLASSYGSGMQSFTSMRRTTPSHRASARKLNSAVVKQ
jgi:hypothetical protein